MKKQISILVALTFTTFYQCGNQSKNSQDIVKQEVVKNTKSPVNKYGEIIPLKFGYGYDKTQKPNQVFIDDWKLGDTSNYLKGGFAYPIGGWFDLGFNKGTFWSNKCKACGENIVIKLDQKGSGVMKSYSSDPQNGKIYLMPADSERCLSEKVNWKFNQATGELKLSFTRSGNFSNDCYAQLDAYVTTPFKRNKNGVWIGGKYNNSSLIFSHSGRNWDTTKKMFN